MTLDVLNALPPGIAGAELLRCCGSTRWAQRMAAARPFGDVPALSGTADDIWWSLGEADWLEAFAAHPRIGENRAGKSGEAGRAGGNGPNGSHGWAGQEQSRVSEAPDDVRRRLLDANREYEARFGYIFIVCATGRSAEEMLGLLERRLDHDPGVELRIAAEEQRKITQLRLMKLLEHAQVPTT